MNSQIWYVGEYSIADGKRDIFKRLIEEVIALEQSAPGLLVYEFFFGVDEGTFYAIELYEDSDAVLKHLERCGQILPKILEIAKVTRFEICGNATQSLRDALAPFGAKFYPYWVGFKRGVSQ